MNKSDKIITAAALAGIDIKISEKETQITHKLMK